MIEDTKIVKKIEAKAGGKSGTYWAVTWQDDKRDNVFSADWLSLLEQSQKENRLLHFTKEKKGDYYNIVSLELATLPETHIEEPRNKTEVKTDEKVESVKILSKDEQIERAVWIKEWGECIRSGDINKTTPEGKALRNAYYTEMCRVLGINIKEVQSAKSLIEEAKKMKIWNC